MKTLLFFVLPIGMFFIGYLWLPNSSYLLPLKQTVLQKAGELGISIGTQETEQDASDQQEPEGE